ncbi:MAG: glycosyltransferase family 4 protein, partial [Armatimonadetes bacterium]|nr:glycosyltransferase family 4 protein [Armatimonadota bacterium]
GIRAPRPSGAPLRLLYFGFVWRGRNIETCVHALHAVHAAGVPATLTIAGGIRGDEYRREIVELAASLGVADAVTFTGDLPMPELSQIIADADIALLPFASGVSTGRSTFVVALAHGLPVVTMGSPDNLVDEFVPGENLLCVSPDDADGFVRETVRMATDAALRARVAGNTPALAAYFSWDKIARTVAALPSYAAL